MKLLGERLARLEGEPRIIVSLDEKHRYIISAVDTRMSSAVKPTSLHWDSDPTNGEE